MSRDELYADSAQARELDRAPRDAFALDEKLTPEQVRELRAEREAELERDRLASKARVKVALGQLEAFFVNRNKGA